MKTQIPFGKSIMMDKVFKELKEIISTLVVKMDCEANRNETVETRKAGDLYVLAMRGQDSFRSYETYSDYALSKVELDQYYNVDKTLIPKNLRKELVSHQRLFTIRTYTERNEYYRNLAGLPSLEDMENEDFIYLDEVSISEIEGVDKTKPIHEMTEDEIIIIENEGLLDKIIKNHPEKKYLNHLSPEKRIDIVTARTALNYKILYIYSDRNKQPITEMFINLYNKSRDYVLDRFYDETYNYRNDYYGNFIGLFILTITIQRFITNYFHKFINRDFYDKDIIKLLFDSYDIPFYNDIPLTYSQKVAKNLNRLFYYKSTNKVFVDIFKIFDMDNIQVCNYILFKNPKVDDIGRPLLIYNEKTEVGYQVETDTNFIQSTDDFYGVYKNNYINVKKIVEIKHNDEYCRVVLLSNGIVNFYTDKNTSFYTTIKSSKTSIDDYGNIQFDENYDIKDLKLLFDKNNNTYCVFFCKNTNLLYTFKYNKIEKIDLKEKFSSVKTTPDSVLIKQDEKTLNKMLIINNKNNSIVYLNTNGNYLYKTTLNEFVLNGDYYDNAIALAMSSGKLVCYGDNKDYRLLARDSLKLNYFMEVNDVPISVRDVKIFETGCVFILKNGTIRYSRYVPLFSETKAPIHYTELVKKYNNIKGIFDLYDGEKRLYCLITFDGKITFLNYSYDDKFGQLLFKDNTKNLMSNYNNIRNIDYTHDGILITNYGTSSKISYSGTNKNGNFPFISTLNMITEENNLNIKFLNIYLDLLFFVTEDNKFAVYKDKKIIDFTDKIGNENIQKFINTKKNLYILTGKYYIYRITSPSDLIDDLEITKISLSEIITDVFYNGLDEVFVNNKNKLFKLSGNNLNSITYYNMKVENDDIAITIKPYMENSIIKYKVDYSLKNKNKKYKNKIINNVNRIDKIALYDNVLFMDGDKIYFIKLNEFSAKYNDIDAYIHEELSNKRAKSEIINNELVIYNINGGISVIRGFIHSDRLDAQIVSDHVSLFDEEKFYIKQIMFDDENIFIIKEEDVYVTYEEAVDEMYDLKFIEVPMDANNKAEYISDTTYHLDYDLVVSDDKLWGGDRDKKEFVKEILKDEFNYYTSKYISINSTYDLSKLNFEVAYMFRMLTELKDNEKYLRTNVKFVGDNVLIFDIVVGLFALTCKKMGLEGRIPDTKTKALTVLGFNFSLDMPYIDKIIKEHRLEDVLGKDFDFEKIKIKKPKKAFVNAAEEVNLYLDNEQVMEDIYTYKWNAKSIEEYNAWRKIELASLNSNYVNDIYKINDEEIAETYLEYLKIKNPAMYNLVNNADPDNLIEEMDYLLLALSDYLASDKYKYLFLNIPSLSMDSLRKFIYYLIYIFKSYTVDLKAMNIIYHIDDKRLSNIKLVLEEDAFKKQFCLYDELKFADMIDYTLKVFNEFEKLKFKFKKEIDAKFSYSELIYLINFHELIFNGNDVMKMTVIKDFSDFITDMQGIFTKEQVLKLTLEAVFETMFADDSKGGLNSDNLIFIDLFDGLYKSFEDIDKIKLKQVEDFISEFIHSDEFKINFYDECIKQKQLTHEEKIKLKEILDIDIYYEIEKGLIGDFSDFVTTINSNLEANKEKINFNESYYFIRN